MDNSSKIDLVSEADVLVRWPALSKSRLRMARKTGCITWIKGKRGSAWYREDAIETFIQKELEQPCRVGVQIPYSQSANNGSQKIRNHHISTDSGLSPDLAELAAQASGLRILRRQK